MNAAGCERLRAVFVLEQTLGHITHGQNLRSLLADHAQVASSFLPIPFDGPASHVPLWSNWTVRAGVRATRAIRRERRHTGIDVLMIHTQVPAILNRRWMRRVPTVVSLDATPVQYDRLGAHYAHRTAPSPVEDVKRWLHRSCFDRARRIVVWSDWARRSLVDDYAIDARKVHVIPPGVDVSRWRRRGPPPGDVRPVRILFVGGDLDRKGGRELIQAARMLRSDPSVPAFVLELVTRTPLAPSPGIVVHPSLGPNTDELVQLYQRADIFCLPTRGDCLPMVLSEAGAAELPLVSTAVGAIREIVRPGETGLLVPPDDVASLAQALRSLIADRDLRRRLGAAAARLVARDFDARVNAERLVAVLVESARDATS